METLIFITGGLAMATIIFSLLYLSSHHDARIEQAIAQRLYVNRKLCELMEEILD